MGSPRISGFGFFAFFIRMSADPINAPIPDYHFGIRYTAPELLGNYESMEIVDDSRDDSSDVYSLSMIITEACLSPERVIHPS